MGLTHGIEKRVEEGGWWVGIGKRGRERSDDIFIVHPVWNLGGGGGTRDTGGTEVLKTDIDRV